MERGQVYEIIAPEEHMPSIEAVAKRMHERGSLDTVLNACELPEDHHLAGTHECLYLRIYNAEGYEAINAAVQAVDGSIRGSEEPPKPELPADHPLIGLRIRRELQALQGAPNPNPLLSEILRRRALEHEYLTRGRTGISGAIARK